MIPEEERFAKNTVIMIEAVHDSILKLYNAGYKTVDPTIVKLAASVITAFDKEFLIQGFIENSHEKCWDAIKKEMKNIL